jgi:hypothetical protein
MTRSEKGAD